jgi:tRNA pseudouridine55 synthase
MLFGFLNIYKPSKLTSHDVVTRLRKMTGVKQIGHAGTLDPMAVGVLPMAIGSATRLLRFLETDKIYIAEVLLGTATTTDDLDGQVLSEKTVDSAVASILPSVVAGFVGEQKQKPPAYSAIHHGGKRLYELAREGNIPDDVPLRDVWVEGIDIVSVELPVVKLRIKCSGGTYIRAIARDLGEKLGFGACLKSLIREKSGPFLLSQAHTLEALDELAQGNRLADAIVPPQAVLKMDIVKVDREKAKILATGQHLPVSSVASMTDDEAVDGKLCLVMCENSLIALCQVTKDNRLHPEVVVGHAKSLV